MVEVVPGIHRIETKLDGNLLCLHVLRGERTLLVDSGARDTPAAASTDFSDSNAWVNWVSGSADAFPSAPIPITPEQNSRLPFLTAGAK